MIFSMPTTEISVSGQGQAHPAVALGFEDDQRPGPGDHEVRPGDGDLGAEELLPQVRARGLGQPGGVSVRSAGRVAHLAPEDLPDLGPVLVDRGDEDVRRPVVAELHDQLGQVGLDGADPRSPPAPR